MKWNWAPSVIKGHPTETPEEISIWCTPTSFVVRKQIMYNHPCGSTRLVQTQRPTRVLKKLFSKILEIRWALKTNTRILKPNFVPSADETDLCSERSYSNKCVAINVEIIIFYLWRREQGFNPTNRHNWMIWLLNCQDEREEWTQVPTEERSFSKKGVLLTK